MWPAIKRVWKCYGGTDVVKAIFKKCSGNFFLSFVIIVVTTCLLSTSGKIYDKSCFCCYSCNKATVLLVMIKFCYFLYLMAKIYLEVLSLESCYEIVSDYKVNRKSISESDHHVWFDSPLSYMTFNTLSLKANSFELNKITNYRCIDGDEIWTII